MSVAGEVTTYTLDYGNGKQILLEQGGAFSETKHYLYGRECIGELVDADEPESEWRYYHSDGNHLVRQTTNSEAEITFAWAYSPDGAVILGARGPATNLGCGNIYDWSTGLVFKNGRYFDPTIWLTLAPFVVWQAYQPGVRIGLNDSLRVYDGETLVASHQLRRRGEGWVTVSEHHAELWRAVMQVQQRPLAVYEEVATWNS